jgi:hypothetical protein
MRATHIYGAGDIRVASEQTWESQRREDAGERVGVIPVPGFLYPDHLSP